MRLERENKHLSDLVENLRNTTIDTRLQELQNDNTNLSANIVDYKNMITKLTKVGITIIVVVVSVVVVVELMLKH